MIEQLLDEAIQKLQAMKRVKVNDVDVQVYGRGDGEMNLSISVDFAEVRVVKTKDGRVNVDKRTQRRL